MKRTDLALLLAAMVVLTAATVFAFAILGSSPPATSDEVAHVLDECRR